MSNSFYNHGAFPSTGSAATSASMRAELDLVAAGFDKMPTLSGNANKFVVVNSTGTALTQTSTLPSFTVTDTDFTVQDDGDNTRKFQFNAGTVTPGATRIYSVPDANTTLVGTDTTQTLTNKTLTAPVISSIVNTGSLSLPTSTDTLVGRATTDTLTNKTLTSPVIGTIVNTGTLTLPTSTDTLVGRATTDTLTNKTLTSPVIGTIVNTGTLTLPTSTDTLVGRATTDTLTNKTLTSPVIGTIVNTGTLTLPTSTDTLVGRATTDTLTNKTLTSPVIGTIVNTGTLTLPTSTDTLVGRATTDTLTNKTLGAFTISGTVSGGGNQINNVIIGTSNPLAGTFTDLNTTGLVKIPSANRSAAAALTVTNPAFLYGVASTYTDTSSSGTLAAMAAFYSLAQPTLSTNNVTTYTNAATLYIANAPVAGGSALPITNPYALYVAAGASYFGGAVTFASSVGALTVTTLTASTSITNSGLTSGRVPYSTTAGLQTDSANLTFNGTTLTANTIGAFTLGGTVAGGGNQINNVIIGTTNPLAGAFTTITASTSITNSGLTSGRVTYASTGGLLADSANFTYNGQQLTSSGSASAAFIGYVATTSAADGYSGIRLINTGASGREYQVAVGGSTSGQSGHWYVYDATAAATRLIIDSSGNLGIGGTSTGSRLYVTATNPTASFKATTTGYPYAAFVNDGGDFYVGRDNSAGGAFGYAYANVIWGSGAQSTVFGTSNLVRMTLDASGNLGIGTTLPLAKLNASGGTTIASLADWNSKANTVFTLANAAVRLGVGYSAADNPLIQGFDSTNNARSIGFQVYGGNVGLGTPSPATLFHMLKDGVGGSAPNQPELRIQHNDINSIGTGGSNGGILGFVNLQSDNTGWVADSIWGRINFSCSQPTSGAAQLGASILAAADGAIGGQQSASYLAFYTSDGTANGNNVEKARITNVGQFLVGPTSTYNSAKLSVAGDAELRGSIKSYQAVRAGLAIGGTVTLWSVPTANFGTEVSMILYVSQRDDTGGNLTNATYQITGFGGAGVDVQVLATATYGGGRAFTVTATSASGGIIITMTNTSGGSSTSVTMVANVLVGYGAITWGF